MNKIMHLIALLALTAGVAVGQETFATGGGDIEGDGSISFTGFILCAFLLVLGCTHVWFTCFSLDWARDSGPAEKTTIL